MFQCRVAVPPVHKDIPGFKWYCLLGYKKTKPLYRINNVILSLKWLNWIYFQKENYLFLDGNKINTPLFSNMQYKISCTISTIYMFKSGFSVHKIYIETDLVLKKTYKLRWAQSSLTFIMSISCLENLLKFNFNTNLL